MFIVFALIFGFIMVDGGISISTYVALLIAWQLWFRILAPALLIWVVTRK